MQPGTLKQFAGKCIVDELHPLDITSKLVQLVRVPQEEIRVPARRLAVLDVDSITTDLEIDVGTGDVSMTFLDHAVTLLQRKQLLQNGNRIHVQRRRQLIDRNGGVQLQEQVDAVESLALGHLLWLQLDMHTSRT